MGGDGSSGQLPTLTNPVISSSVLHFLACGLACLQGREHMGELFRKNPSISSQNSRA